MWVIMILVVLLVMLGCEVTPGKDYSNTIIGSTVISMVI